MVAFGITNKRTLEIKHRQHKIFLISIGGGRTTHWYQLSMNNQFIVEKFNRSPTLLIDISLQGKKCLRKFWY
jgi:hypothetical protein